MLQVVAGKAPQDRLGLCCSQAEGRGILDHLIILILDQLPVNGLAQDGLQMLILAGIPGFRPGELLRGDILESR